MKKNRKKHIIICSILVLLLIIVLFFYILNEVFISKYEKREYDNKILDVLKIVNIYQPYIAHYNDGNKSFKLGDYEEAIDEYKKALNLFPPEKKECSIRINLALAMIRAVEDENEADVDDILSVLSEAKDVLCEDGCANRNNNKGHSKKAEQLKEDIEEYEEKLKKQQKESEEDDEDEEKDKEEESEDNNSSKKELKKKEEQIKELQKQSSKSRQESMGSIENGEDYQYYSGKKW